MSWTIYSVLLVIHAKYSVIINIEWPNLQDTVTMYIYHTELYLFHLCMGKITEILITFDQYPVTDPITAFSTMQECLREAKHASI